jgi:hypothetical protein
MNLGRRTTLAYFDGYTVEQLAEMDLTESEILEVAALCMEWAVGYARDGKREEAQTYNFRARELIVTALPEGEFVCQEIGLLSFFAAESNIRYNQDLQWKVGPQFFLRALANAMAREELQRERNMAA